MYHTMIITRDGYNMLKEELDYLWLIKRPLITEKVAWAASLGDRSENADYQYNKRLLRHIDSRVRYLKVTMSNIKVADYRPEQEGTVYIGACHKGELLVKRYLFSGDRQAVRRQAANAALRLGLEVLSTE